MTEFCRPSFATFPAFLAQFELTDWFAVQDQHSNKLQSNITGQKSEKALVAASTKKGKKAKGTGQAPADKDGKISYSKSGSVFRKLQEQRDAAAAGVVSSSGQDGQGGALRGKAAAFKL